MDKLKMHTQDIVNDNVKRLAELFPECITEVTTDDDKAVLTSHFCSTKRINERF